MDAVLHTQRTIYSLRHTAICMRIILSHGKVINLAKNAATKSDRTLLRQAPGALRRDGDEPELRFYRGRTDISPSTIPLIDAGL